MNDSRFDIQLFSELYDVHPQAIVWLRPLWNEDHTKITDFEFSYCNEEGLKYLGISSEQQKGLRVSHSPTLTDNLRKAFMAEMLQVYETGKKSETNIYNPALNKYARVLRTKLRGGILTVVQDRTEENRIIKKLEDQTRQLEAREKLLDNLLEFSPAGISVTEVIRDNAGKIVDGRTILANDPAADLLMIPKEVYLSKTVTEIDPDILQSPLYQMSLRTLETGEPFHTQYYFALSGKWIELSVSKMDDDHLINIFLDISTTKSAQLLVEQAAHRLQEVFNASQSGMFTIAPVKNKADEITDFRFVITNPAFAAYVNQTPEVLQGKLGSEYFPGYLHNGVFEMFRQTYTTGETMRKDVHYNADGHDLYLDMLSTRIQDDEVLVTFTDYTTLKQTQLQLEKLIHDLRVSNTNLEEFAHAASHDLKEPIRKIRVFTDRLEGSLGNRMNEMEQGLFQRMQSATQRMTLLVDDLLLFSHLSLKPLQMEEVNLGHLLQLVRSDLEVQIEEKKAVFEIEHLPVVKGYKRQLQQLLQNLVSNALKYSKQDVPPRVTIRSKKVRGSDTPINLPQEQASQRFYLIEVQDNGIGFEPQYAERIFKMFQRLHGRSEYSGTGIGLSIARKVVDNHDGFIWAESEPDQGASFKILLPA